MNWRPWIIVAGLIGVVVVNGALMGMEEVAPPKTEAEVQDKVKDKLAGIPFTASRRRQNFTDFGMPEKEVGDAADLAKKIYERKDRFKEMLVEGSEVVGAALCPSGGTPQRYSAVSFLVKEEDGQRMVIDYTRVTTFEVQEWYDPSLVAQIYGEVELAESPREASTAMGLSALLMSQEDMVIEGKSPWGAGLTRNWSLTKVFSQYPEVKRKLAQYMAFMHVLTEIANDPEDGICG